MPWTAPIYPTSCPLHPGPAQQAVALHAQGVDGVAHFGQQLFRRAGRDPRSLQGEDVLLLPADLMPHPLDFSSNE